MPYGPKCIYVLELKRRAANSTGKYAESIAALLKDKHPAMLAVGRDETW